MTSLAFPIPQNSSSLRPIVATNHRGEIMLAYSRRCTIELFALAFPVPATTMCAEVTGRLKPHCQDDIGNWWEHSRPPILEACPDGAWKRLKATKDGHGARADKIHHIRR